MEPGIRARRTRSGAWAGYARAVVLTGVVPAPADADRYAPRWHPYLWSPYFAVWGVLLGLAARRYQAAIRIGEPDR